MIVVMGLESLYTLEGEISENTYKLSTIEKKVSQFHSLFALMSFLIEYWIIRRKYRVV